MAQLRFFEPVRTNASTSAPNGVLRSDVEDSAATTDPAAAEPVVSGNAAFDKVVNFAFDNAMNQAHWHLQDTHANTFEEQELKLVRAFRAVAQFKMQNAGKLTRLQAAYMVYGIQLKREKST